jgi:hypothetical protein
MMQVSILVCSCAEHQLQCSSQSIQELLRSTTHVCAALSKRVVQVMGSKQPQASAVSQSSKRASVL